MPGPQIHYVSPPSTSWTPRAVMVLDTETRTEVHGTVEVEALRLWRAALIDRQRDGDDPADWAWFGGVSQLDIARMIHEQARRHLNLWIFAHNLSFDLVTTRLPEHLAALGWSLADVALSSETPWLRMRRSKCRLTIADSHSWLPRPAAEVGRMIGYRKLPLPRQDASERAWRNRCDRDVTIIALALLRLMAWHDLDGGGRWSVTGPATGWGQCKSRIPPKTILLNPEREAASLDRQALYGGRREAFRVGRFDGHRATEIDFSTAYPMIARDCLLPVRRGAVLPSVDLESPMWDLPLIGFISRCRVRTDTPRYPLRTSGGVLYPVGEFDTILAGPELHDARDNGRLVRVGHTEIHFLSDALRPWATWCLDELAVTPPHNDLVVQTALKVWSRSVIGRWSGHSWAKIELGPAPGPGWRYEPGTDGSTGRPGGMLDLGGRRWWTAQQESSPSAYPAITAFVESHVRVRLGKVVDAIGRDAILTVDTDGLIVREALVGKPAAGGAVTAPDGLRMAGRVQHVLDAVADLCAPLTMRPKRSSTHCEILGPQHVRLGAQRKLPGVPADADETEANTFQFRAWPKITWQLEHGDRTGYHRPLVTRRLDGPYPPGWIATGGVVVPPAATITSDDQTRVLPWHATPHRPKGARLRGPQHPYLDDLL